MANNSLFRGTAVLIALMCLWLVSPAFGGAQDDSDRIDPILSRFPPPYEAGVAKRPVDGRLLDAAVADPIRFLDANRLVPYQVPGWRTAYRLETITDPILLTLGLEEGDLILGINGVDLGAMEQLATALSMLRHASLLQVVVQRRGVIFALTFEILGRPHPL
ncbi:MAG: hypothetical protein HY208_05600 [Nitrospirae bacterium]|nr:hypothetical protein [Nitrospirota bacterium]